MLGHSTSTKKKKEKKSGKPQRSTVSPLSTSVFGLLGGALVSNTYL
uniref:Uncharacterized protein n=1 Tax=Anguilla anguilla TaxID=7936 RepID=A0A0E9U5K4_ANGAN